MRRFSFSLLTALLALTIAVPAVAQGTGGLKGTVLDKDGQPIVGATVSVSNPDLNINTGAATDAKGEFRIAPLPPGKGYSLTVAFPTMGKITQSDIEVPANKMLVVPITLRPSKELTETVKVTGTSDVVDTESTTTSTNISSEFIDALPILGRNYQDVLTLAPGVTDVDGDGNPNIHGARDTDVNTLVDGVSTVDPVTGQVGQQLNINSIQDVEVITSGASAEFDRAQGGFVRVSTKSGGNDFEGSFRFDWRGSVLDGDGAGIDPATLHGGLTEHGLRDLTFNDLLPALTVSGPIVKDKAWYFVSAEYRQIETPINSVTQAFVQEHDEFRVFGKASWDMSTNHKLVFTATFDPQSDNNFGLNSFTAIESGYTQYSGGRNLVLTERAVFSPNVFLETTLQHFVTHPEWEPTTDADTNHNGMLYDDRNHNGFIDATERDAGEDWDRDGAFDVYEDFRPANGQLDSLEDVDHDGRLTPRNACEGLLREDIDCDHHLDAFNEDDNGNGVLDLGEDRDADGRLDTGIEDRNHDNQLNDRPFPATDGNNNIIRDENGVTGNFYPYHEPTPTPSDRDYTLDFRTLRVNGPFNQDFTGDRGRQTLRQDLTMFVPDWHGQHELKTGYVIEREHYDQTTNLRPLSEPNLKPPTTGAFIATIGVILPAENQVENTATSLTGALYVHDTFKPVPNLTLNLGVRFTRESTDSFGYSQFNPVAERALFDRLGTLTGQQRNYTDLVNGDGDGQENNGICDDAMFPGECGQSAPQTIKDIVNGLQKVKISHLTQHHTSTSIVAADLVTLFPDSFLPDGTLDRNKLREQGAVFQTEEPFRLTNNNLAPRLAVSWDPWADSKTKVFASWGRFYDKLFLNSVVREEGPDTIQRYYKKDTDFVSDAGLPNNGYGTPLSKAPPSTYQIDRGLQTPFTDEWSVGFERELAPEVSLSLRYIRRDARLGLQDRDINHVLRYNTVTGMPLDGVGQLNFGPGDGGSGTPAGDMLPDLYIQNFFFNQIYRLGNFNTSKFTGIELEITKRLSRKWQMDASYSYSRAMGDAEDFTSALGDDPAAVPYEYGYLLFDQRHIVRFNGTTFLPGDWAVGGVVQWATGLPYSLETTAFSLDNFQYPSFRTLFGQVVYNADPDGNPNTLDGVWQFEPENRNSRRNKPQLNIDLQASKSFVMGRYNSKLFLAVANLLNTDDLTITTYQPDNPNRGGALQIDAQRRFGRRYSIGFQFEF